MRPTGEPRLRPARVFVLGMLAWAASATPFVATGAATAQPAQQAVTAGATAVAPRPTRPNDGRGRQAVVSPPPDDPSRDPLRDQARQTAERDRLTTRIADLRRRIALDEKSRSGAAAALARAERSLAEVTRHLDDLAQRQKATRQLVGTLDRQRAGVEGQVAAGQAAFARTMTRFYANQDRHPLRIYLGGGDPNDAALNDAYLRYLARAGLAEVEMLRGFSVDLQARRRHADDDGRALALEADAQTSAREALAAEQLTQRRLLGHLSQQLSAQRSTASALESDEKRLTRVVERLQRVIEQQAAAERARRDVAKRLAEKKAAAQRKQDRQNGPARDAVPTRERPPRDEASLDEPAGAGAFARLRGQLRLPARGSVTGRYGSPRGNGGATWKGLFVRTETGADVRAVAAGKVIFADDLRGFGNLLIVDHGDQYLSIYGNNDSLSKHAGDTVQPGDIVSHAGNSSGDDQTGLYFELRFQGRPFDPTPWIGR